MQNYHKHTSYSTVFTPFKDSAASHQDYIDRNKELGSEVITSVEHGYQGGDWGDTWSLAKKNNMKYVHGTEAYWVRDRKDMTDRSNSHIIVLAKTMNGFKLINKMLSIANQDGYYYVPRIDHDLIFNMLNKDDVFITSACVSFWGKIDKETNNLIYNDGIDDFVLSLHKKFGDSFMLELQAHNTNWQKEINKKIIDLSNVYGIRTIAGLDSHYIYPEQEQERQDLRKESGVKVFAEEHEFQSGIYSDYPSESELIRRFNEQGVLSSRQVEDAIKSTNLTLNFDDLEFDTSFKIPVSKKYRDLSQLERNNKYLDEVWDGWSKYKEKNNISDEEELEYMDSINKETRIIVNTNFSDYFLINKDIIADGIKKGGRISQTSRGSSSSFFTNTLLGFSTLDRHKLPVDLFLERFADEPRLKTSMPDIDFNVSNRKPFIEAQSETVNSYPMIAYGKQKEKSAIRMYCRSLDIPVNTQDEIVKQLDKYENDLKYSDEGEYVDPKDYLDEKYHEIFEASLRYRNIVVSKSQAPCGFLLYDGDIESDVGLIRVKSPSSKNDVMCTVLSGYCAERMGYLKNDLLIVDVVEVNARAMEYAGLHQIESSELLELTKDDKKTWDMFANGAVVGINQLGSYSTREKLMKYKPKSVKELSAFVAAIRPGFKTMVDKFINREKFKYNVDVFDKLLQNDETGSSWLLYQENVMKCLSLAGIPMEETYPIIKAISKKKASTIEEVRIRFIDGFSAFLKKSGIPEDDAKKESDDVFQIMIDSSNYLFNASHSIAVAIDALYGAYLKANHTFAYYKALLEVYEEKNHKDKIAEARKEMYEMFGIEAKSPKFRDDNRGYYINKEKGYISSSLKSVKGVGKAVGNTLYKLGKTFNGDFVDLLNYLQFETSVNKGVIKTLIMIGYFEEFGGEIKLLKIFEAYHDGENKIYKTLMDKTVFKRMKALKEYADTLEDKLYALPIQVQKHILYMGYSVLSDKKYNWQYVIQEISKKGRRRLTLYSLGTGSVGQMVITKNLFDLNKLEECDIIDVKYTEKVPKFRFVNGQYEEIKGEYLLSVGDLDVLYKNDYIY